MGYIRPIALPPNTREELVELAEVLDIAASEALYRAAREYIDRHKSSPDYPKRLLEAMSRFQSEYEQLRDA